MKATTGNKIRFAFLLFAVLFSLSAAAHYWFVEHQMMRTVSSEVEGWLDQVAEALPHKNGWRINEFRQAEIDVPGYYAFTSSGLVLDIWGLVPGLLPAAHPPPNLRLDEPLPFVSDAGEKWLLYGKKLSGGLLIAGIRNSQETSHPQETLLGDAAKFGSTAASASALSPRQIAEATEYCVLDDSGHILSASGGVPIMVNPEDISALGTTRRWRSATGEDYLIFARSLFDAAGERVGLIVIPRKVTEERSAVRWSNWYNIVSAIILWTIVVVLTGRYFVYVERRSTWPERSLDELLMRGEGEDIEFKSSARWDYRQDKVTDVVKGEVTTTVAGFLNSNGGTVVIGVEDGGKILGLEADYRSLPRKDRDGFESALQGALADKVGTERVGLNVRIRFDRRDDKDLCLVEVRPSPEPVYVEVPGPHAVLYIRSGNTTRLLDTPEAVKYVKEHWSSYV